MSALKSYCFLNPSVQSTAESCFDESELNLLCGMMHRTMVEKKETDGGTLRSFRFKSDKRQCVVVIAATADEHTLLVQELREEHDQERPDSSRVRTSASPYLIWIFRLLPFLRGETIDSMPEWTESLLARLKAILQAILSVFK